MCDMSHHCDCGPMCLNRIMPFLEGFIIIVLGVFLFMTNYGFMDSSIWQWLLPVTIMLAGFRWITRESYNNCDCNDMDDCYDVDMMCDDESCGCDDEEGACACEGECTCDTGAEDTESGCGCGNGCGCGDKKEKVQDEK